MNFPDEALLGLKKRFGKMVESPLITLWKARKIEAQGYGGGTNKHAWSGGTLTLLSK